MLITLSETWQCILVFHCAQLSHEDRSMMTSSVYKLRYTCEEASFKVSALSDLIKGVTIQVIESYSMAERRFLRCSPVCEVMPLQ